AVGGWIGVGAYVYRSFHSRSFIWRTGIAGELWQGEVVFLEQHLHPQAGPYGPSRVMAFNPRSGLVRPLGMELVGGMFACVSDGRRLWAVGQHDVAVTDGSAVTHYHPNESITPSSLPFLLD